MIFPKKTSDLEDIKKAVEPEEEIVTTSPNIGAPLFVKIEKYRDIVKSVQEIRTFIAGTKQAFTILSEIETIRKDALNILKTTMQRLEKRTVELDNIMLRPRGIPFEEESVEEVGHVEDGLMDLQRQISELKKDLETLR
ncbi:MAG: hypothetical protein HZB66_01925 [Candidatus Aenigmarchaeota archaeon]|nr:hypothetical protein [Candidatus Aenigmarchaeota archaeon]